MTFDATVSITGRNQCACVLIKQELQKDLSYLARHHNILEQLAQTASTTLLPEVLLFKRFKAKGKFFNKVSALIDNDEEQSETVKDLDTVAWAKKSLRERIFVMIRENFLNFH